MSTTNGWDAVCAMSLPQVNALMFQQYLRHGPTSPAKPLRLILNVEAQYWILDAVLGPPELSFNADSQTANLAMELVRGSLIAFDSEQNVQNAMRIRPKESKLTGDLSLARVDVKDTLGSLVAELGARAYAPKIKGVDPNTVLNTTLGEAVRTYFANNDTTFPIGTVAPVAEMPASLQPTDFKFAIQQKPGSSDACVLLLIQTNGPAGAVQPLNDYPIPDNHTAALRVSARAVFSGVLTDYLNGAFSELETQFTGQQSGDAWSTKGSGGSINCGYFGKFEGYYTPWSSDGHGNRKAIVFPLDGFTVSASQGRLSANWSSQISLYFSMYETTPRGEDKLYISPVTFRANYGVLSPPSVDPVSDQITFAGSGSVSVSWEVEEIVLKFLDGPALNDWTRGRMQSTLQRVFNSFQLPSLNTFALANLLFPAEHVISLSDAALPGDLNLTGSMATPIAVTPANSAIGPGATVQFTAAVQAGGVLWEILPRLGSISASGLYTAPATIDEATVVVVTAVSQSDASHIGSAMVLVFESAAAQGVDVAPGISVVTPDQKVMLSCTDSSGTPLAVTWTLSPNIGQMTSGWSTGQYTYKAPATIATATQVTATAVNQANAVQSGSTVIQVAPTATVTVRASSATAKPGATVPLTATVSAGHPDDLAWVVYPIGAGTVTADPDDASKATYTAPNPAGANTQARVVAYLVSDEAAGLGGAGITLRTPLIPSLSSSIAQPE